MSAITLNFVQLVNFATHSESIQHEHNLATQLTLATLLLHLLTMVGEGLPKI